jgi:pimeloyl-ACP methyl ester carboxylesterase
VVWGERSSLWNLEKLEITGRPTDRKLKPCGLVEQIQILGRFWAVDQYNLLLAALKDAGYEQSKKNLFVFAYDWRQSNVVTADLLDQFIQQNLAGKDFDILAHSMGGIVSRIYMRDKTGQKLPKRIVYMGTPFLGSMNTFATIKEGWDPLKNRLAGGQNVIWRVALSFPGMLELLPRYDDCCYMRTTSLQRDHILIFKANVWKKLGWLPEAYNDPARFEQFQRNLERSEELTPLLKSPAPAGVHETLFASDTHSTYRKLGMWQTATRPGDWFFSREVGDGTVPAWSAARRPDQADYGNSLPSFAEHSTIFDDKWLIAELTRLFFKRKPEDPDPVASRGKPSLSVQINGQAAQWAVKFADVAISDVVVPSGNSAQATLKLKLEDVVSNPRTRLFLPEAVYRHGDGTTKLAVSDATTQDDLDNKTLVYGVTVPKVADGTGVIIFYVSEDFSPTAVIYGAAN